MKKPKRKQTPATTSEFRKDTPLTPEELNPSLPLPFYVRDNDGLPLPNYPQAQLLPWLTNIRREADSILEKEGFWETKRGKTLIKAAKWYGTPSKAIADHLGHNGIASILHELHRADNESAMIRDALAARFHSGALLTAVDIMEDRDPSSVQTWFYFGAICALYLGAAATRLNLLPFESDANLGRRQRRAGATAAGKRWHEDTTWLEKRNAAWRTLDVRLQGEHPEWSDRKRHEKIAERSQKKGIPHSTVSNVRRVLGKRHRG